MAETVKIETLILDTFNNCRTLVADIFDVEEDDIEALAPFVKLMAALRFLPPDGLEEVARPVITQMFGAFNLDPTNEDDREQAAEIVDLFALAIQDATNMMIQAMQHQQQAATAIAQGRGNLLRG